MAVRQDLQATMGAGITIVIRLLHPDLAGAVTRFMALALLLGVAGGTAAAAQSMTVGIIDFYGLERVPAADVRAALTVKEGESIAVGAGRPAFIAESERRIAALPGVRATRVNLVCCDAGRAIVYVGVEEQGAPVFAFRAAPTGAARLPADVVAAGAALDAAIQRAVQRGAAGEDRSQGHSLSEDPEARAIQEQFIAFARRDHALLREVLKTSAVASERALAAQVLAYLPVKAMASVDLVPSMDDPDVGVRNDVVRALMVFAEMRVTPGTSTPWLPRPAFIKLLKSPVWTDRNKAAGALEVLTRLRDSVTMDQLRRDAMPQLVEMARWKSEGHAQASFLILARVAGYADSTALALWGQGEREVVIAAAQATVRPAMQEVVPVAPQAAAVVMLGDERESRRLYPVMDSTRYSWAFAPAMAIPAADGRMSVAYGPVSGPYQAYLVILTGTSRMPPALRVSMISVSPGRLSGSAPAPAAPRVCVGGDWMAAFFVEGLGVVPPGPVELRYTSRDSTSILVVDPARHTLRARPALRLGASEFQLDSVRPDRLSISVLMADQMNAAWPVMARRDSLRWTANGSGGPDSRTGVLLSGYGSRAPILDWRLYLLDLPPNC